MSNSQIEAYERVKVVAGDAPEDMQKELINILIRVKKLYGSHSQVSSHNHATTNGLQPLTTSYNSVPILFLLAENIYQRSLGQQRALVSSGFNFTLVPTESVLT